MRISCSFHTLSFACRGQPSRGWDNAYFADQGKSPHMHTHTCIAVLAASRTQQQRYKKIEAARRALRIIFSLYFFLFARGVVVRGVVMEFSSPAKREGLCTAAAHI